MSPSKLYTIDPGTSLHVTITGSPSSSPSLIFLHFWGGSSLTYTHLTPLLPSHHCISISFRGWGLSTGPSEPSAYSIHDFASEIEALIPQLEIHDFVLIGHSMGGKVAQLLAGRNIFRNRLKGMVLLAPAPPTPLQLPEDMKEQQRTAYSSPVSAEFVIRNVLTSRPLSEEVVQVLVSDMIKGNRFAREAWPEYGMGESILEEARGVEVPVLVVVGSEDRVETEERVRREVLAHLRGEMVVVEGAGHLLPVEAPKEVAGLIEGFIGKL